MRGRHTTLIDLAAEVRDIVSEIPGVRGITNGFITAGTGSGSGARRVKLLHDKGSIRLVVRSSASLQELRIFCRDGRKTMFEIAKALRNNDIAIAFH